MHLLSIHSIKKGFLTTACAAAVSLGASSAQATESGSLVDGSLNFYVSMFGGVGFAGTHNPVYISGAGASYKYATKFKTSFIVGGAIGVENFLIENLRTEIEVSYFRFKPESLTGPFIGFGTNVTGQLSSVNILANAWYDFDPGMAISPYLGGGIGIGFVNNRTLATHFFGGTAYTGKDVGFAFQLGTGFKYDISKSIGLDIGYRFRGVLGTRPTSGTAGGFTMKRRPILVHTVQAGISFKLPPM